MNRAEWEKLKKSTQPSNKYAFGDTSIDVLGNVLQGAVKGLEGIFDISSTAVGAIGGLFDKEFQKSVQERIKFDYTSWLFNPNDMKKDTQGSLINKLGDKGQMIARGTAQGLGQMLPAIGANVLIPGSGLATLGVSAAGTGTESAYQEGADYGEGAAYGILSGVVEMATEKLTGGFTKGVVGKGLLDDAIDGALKKVGKSALFKFAKNFAEEGFEEMLATAIEPTLRSIYQEGAYKETFSKEHTEQMLYDGLIGGLTSMAYGGTLGQIGKSTRNVTESIEDYNKIDAKKTSLWEKGKLDDVTELKLNAEKEATQVELKKRLSKLSDEKRAQVIKDYKLDIDESGNFRSYESEDGYNKSAYSSTLHGKEKTLRYKPVKGETTEAQKQAIKLHSDINKISRVKTDIVIAEDLGTIDGNKVGASFENGVMYIDSSINDETVLKRKIIHEMTHSAETIGKGAYATYRDALLNAMKGNAEVKKLLDPKGDLWQSTVQRYKAQLEGKTEFEQAYIVTTELVAQYSEVLFSDAKVIERLTQDNRNVAQKLYNKIKNLIEYWQSRKGKTAQEKDYLAFLRNAEKMYKAALESNETRSDLKTVRAIGEKIESKPTANTDTERNSIDYGELTENQYQLLSKTTNIEYYKNKNTNEVNVYATNKYGNLEYTANFESLKSIQKTLGVKLGGFIFDNATNNTQRMMNDDIKSYYIIQNNYDYSDIIQKAKKHFGTTVNLNIGAWINTDGTMLKFGESSNNSRDMDHREIQNIMPYLTGSDAMYKYIELGNIRHMPETGSIEMAHKPTQQQMDVIRRIVRKNYGEITIDLWDENETTFNESDRLTSIEYPEGTKEYKIINDIVNFYENGKTPKVSPLAEFRYSLDSDGNTLTQAQQEFFKDSKVRDDEGRLLKVYHGTKEAGFTVFEYDENKQTGTNYGKAFYFTSNYIKAQGYSSTSSKNKDVLKYQEDRDKLLKKFMQTKSEEDKNSFLNYRLDGKTLFEILDDESTINEGSEVKTLFLNIKNPFIADANGEYYYKVYPNYFKQARENNNDGLIIKNVIDNPKGKPIPIDVYVAFEPNQIKLTDNLNPTSDNDIRFSLDSDGKKLTQEQIEFFKDSKVLDEKGNLLKVYHGTKAEFTVFDKNKYNQNEDGGDYVGEGFFFAKNSNTAKRYGSKVISAYLNIENPLIINTEEDSKKLRKTFMNAYQNGDQELRDLFGDSGDYDYYTLREENPSIIREELQRRGYDGLIDNMYGQFAVFDSNQIKLTTNENPTNDDDIRYSIEDFGEKIGGARKDVWMKRGLQSDDLQYLNDAELEKYVKKDYVWRPINYQKMLSEGVERGMLYLQKTTRDSIPATLYIFKSSSQAERETSRKIYVDTINKIRDGITNVKSANDLSNLSDEIFIKPGYIEKRDGRYVTSKLFYENKALDVALFNNWQKIIKMFDKLDSWAEREKIGLGKTDKALENYSIKQNDDGKYYIYKKTWMGYSQISDTGFDNEEVANTILRMAVEKDQTGKQANRKQRIVPPQLERINRKGIDYRSNKNVTGDDYLSMFKFRGGEFGNWLNENDRQTSLNYGYDALMDLADALNIEKENISLNGDLAIAFGARGQGLSGASAHYEPERRVINLTKMNGAGSLAHEWFHAVDKYIAGKDTTSLFSQMYSYQRKSVPEKTSKAFDNVIETMKYVTRKQTDAEIDMRMQRVYESAKRVVDRAFKDYFTNNFEEDMTPERLAIYGKNRRNATIEEKKQYQELKNRVYDGDTAAWAELDKLRKTVTNRQIPRGDGASSYTYDQVFYQILSLNKENIKKAYGTEEAPTIHEETTYFKNSKRMGEISQKDGGYWESPEEMLARAFATYIQDKTNAGNDYLTAHAEAMATWDVDKEGKEYVLKAYPEGEERKRINAAFDKLFAAMKEDGFFKEFEGTRPIQIISYHSNKEGKSGQDLFTQEPITERKDLPIKEEIEAKETSEMPTPKEFYTKTTQMNLFDEESNKNVQLSLFDDNTRFSILAADDKTMYNEKEIKAAMESALAEALNLGNFEYGELSKMAEKDMMDLFENELKNSKDINATAKKIAEFIVMNATVENAMAEDDATPEDYKTYNILKYYRNKFNLDGIKEDIKHAFGNDTTAFLHWGKRKGTNGVTADVIAKELESKGIYIDAINEADIFIKFIDMYKEVSDKVNGRAKEIKKTVSQTTNGFMVDSIIDDLSNDIKGILDKSARKALPSDVAREKNKKISELRKQIQELASKITELETQYGSETEKSNEYRMEMYHLQYKIDRLILEMQDTKSYSDYLSKSLKIVREDVKNVTNRLANEMVKHRLENRLFERIDRVKNLTNYAGSGVQYADEVIALVKVLKKAKTWRGQLSSNIREIMRTYARTVDGKALYDILAKSENVYGQAIQSIANGTGDLSNGELRVLAEIFDNFVHNVNEYDRVFFEGRKQSERELADQAIKDTETIVPFKQGSIAKMWQRFDNWLESPIWRFSRLSNYDDDGVMNRIFWEITAGLKKQEEFNMRVAEYFKPFIKKNKSIAKSWREVITINGKQMSRGQAMGLYLSSLREQMKTHLYNKTETIVTENGISVKRKGIIRLVDESLAETSLREAQEKGKNIEVTEEFINGLFAEFTSEEREFVRLAYDFFNKMSAEAKTETDMALYGVPGNVEKHYYPIRVADDQIYKQIGNQKPFFDLFTVYNPSFTENTTKNANNVVVIENILDVVNRHSRQMAAYYGLAQPIKAFNRVWNAKTEKGTLKQAVMKVDSGFEHYVSQLFNDMQGNNEAKEGFDKVLSKMRGWGAIASLGLNPKVWANQSVSLLAAKGVGFKYRHLMAGLAKTISGKTDFETLTRLSPLMYSRFRDGHNIDSGLLQEGKGLTGKIGTLQEITLAPISWMDKMMIGSIWNAALIQYGTPEKAALMVEKAVIITQANYTPLFRPQILRSHSSALQLMTMFMSEPLQMYSQLAGAVDKLRVAKFLKDNAKTTEETEKANKLLAKAKEDGRNAFTAVSVDMVMLSFIAMLFDWIKGKDDEEKPFSEKLGNEMLGNIMGMFPIAREIYSLSQGFDITNMAYTGLTNIYNAANEIYGSTKSLISGEYQSPQEIQSGIRKTIVGLSQAFGIPLRNLETYTKGIAEKFNPGAVETYESWFYKKSEKAYQDMMTEAIAKGDEKFADTLAGLILDNKLTLTNKTVIDETKRLYLQGFDSMPNTINKTMTYDGKEYELTARDFSQFTETYLSAEKEVEKLLNSYQYKRLKDDEKSEAIKIIYDYYYNIAKSELVGEDVSAKSLSELQEKYDEQIEKMAEYQTSKDANTKQGRYNIDLIEKELRELKRQINLSELMATVDAVGLDKLALVVASAKKLQADKNEEGKSISGSKKYKIEQAMIGLYLTAKQKAEIMKYLGYSTN